jgi:predicted RNase H-like HicB family nuclease
MRKAILLSLIVEFNDDGFLASCPGIQGAFAEGDTIEEAIFNCIDMIKMIASYRAERGESLKLDTVELTPNTQVAISIPIGVKV